MAPCLLLFLLVKTVSSLETTPVIVLDPRAALRAGSISANPFHETSPNDFTDIVHDAIHLSETILIFVEEAFSVEDISTKDSLGNPYQNIHENFLEEKAKYLSNVVEPYKTLKRLLPPLESNVVYVKHVTKPLDKNFKYHYLFFTEPAYSSETRVQRLRRHDHIISQAYNNLSAEHSGPVIVFYTGKTNPMLRLGRTSPARPAPAQRESSDTVMMVTDKALIRLSGVLLQNGALRTRLTDPSMSARAFALRRLSTRMLYHDDIELDFNFEYLQDSWLLDSVVLLEGGEEVGRTTMGVGAPYDWSYFCSEPLIIVNTRDKSYVTISKYQVEPLRAKLRAVRFQDPVDKPPPPPPMDVPTAPSPGADKPPAADADKPPAAAATAAAPAAAAETATATPEPVPDKPAFTNTQSCGTNFNCRILAGLFVSSIVLAITLAGITILCDCVTNNRMDDPAQKPLVIVAQL